MKYTKKDLGSYKLHLIQTNKFKTMTMKVIFHTPIIKEEITKRNILSDILLQSSKKYETRRDMTIESEELYAADVSANNQRLGNYILTSFVIQVLNDKYTEMNNFEKSVEFLSEIIFNPDVENKKFNSEKLDIVKNNAEVALNSIKEDTSSYSLLRLMEAFDKESPISYRMTGYLEDLEKITEENLYSSYEKMINNDYVDIFIVGEFDNKEVTSIIKKYFKFKKIKKEKGPYKLDIRAPKKRRLFAKETTDNSQSKLSIACPITNLTDYEKNYPLVLANIIFGGGPDSKLFKEVREENSLCYTIHSFTNKLDSMLIITSGIDKNNYTKALELITKDLQDMKKGNIDQKDIDIAKSFYKTSIESIEESEFNIINEYLYEEILNLDPIEERKTKMDKVRKQDITRVCKKITMDTVFLLEGGKHEED